MAVTIKVNGQVNSLVHKGSNGVSAATLPDVCKTPSPGGPVPMPYPNVSMSSTLKKGTKTVKADGGMMAAVKGSEFSLSNGDQPGTAGGIKSSTFMKESTWILYSFDVKLEGKNACRLTDKKFQNHSNTVDLGGTVQPPVIVAGINLTDLACECIRERPYSIVSKRDDLDDYQKCLVLGCIRHSCVNKKLKDQDAAKKGVHCGGGANYDSDSLPDGKNYCRPDIVITAPGVTPPIDASQMTAIYDMKFQCTENGAMKPASQWDPRKQLSAKQRKCYEDIKLPKPAGTGKAKAKKVKVGVIAPTSENCS